MDELDYVVFAQMTQHEQWICFIQSNFIILFRNGSLMVLVRDILGRVCAE